MKSVKQFEKDQTENDNYSLKICFFISEWHLFTMQQISKKTIKLLSRSGLILIFLSMAGSFVMATLSITSGGVEEQAWLELFGMLFLAVLGIAVYYMALALFGWMEVRKKNQPSSAD